MDPFSAITALLTLTAMEIVLGIDNVVFIAILCGRLPEEQQPLGRKLGLAVALITRLLLLCLLDPMGTKERAKPGANILVLVADNSEGLNLKDADADQSRAAELAARLKPGAGRWQQKLANDFDVRRYAFDSRLRSINSFAELKFDGPSKGPLRDPQESPQIEPRSTKIDPSRPRSS